ncbi:Odorant receptor 3 [Blattella germanica]|nr:Odorant receptor 3 [Blattella germanica]
MIGHKKQNLLNRNLIALYISGFLCPPNWQKNLCKKILYQIFTLETIAVFPAIITVQTIELFHRFDDLFATTAILFQLACFISVYINFLYFLYYKPELIKLMDRIEIDFVPLMERVGSSKRRETILAERHEKSSSITILMISMHIFVTTAWGILPWVLSYIDYFIKTEEELAEVEIRNYFGCLMWLPENVMKSPKFEVMQLFHFWGIYGIVSNITSCYMIMFMLTFHTATIFRLICAAFEDIDEFERSLRNEENFKKNSCVSDGKCVFVEIPSDEGFNENSNEEHDNISRNRKQENAQPFINDANGSNVSNPQVNEEIRRRMNEYLINCIEFHQAAITYIEDLNDLVSPMVFIFFIFTEVMLCLSSFQLALAKWDEKKIKFLSSVSCVFTWPLLLCIYGDDLKSSAVKESAFSIRWYCQSKTFNKLLQMVMIRAQQPVCIRAGKFYVATLETFSDLCHKVYAYLTLLRQMYDNS